MLVDYMAPYKNENEKRKEKRDLGMEDQAFYNFIESLHIFYSELSTKYMKYCNILDRNADNLLF